MMNTSKVLMILGGLLVGAAGTSYMMLLQADHRAADEARAGMDDSSLQAPSANSRVGDNQVTEGSIDSSQTSGAITKGASIPPSVAQQPAAPAPAPAPKKAAPESAPPAAQAMAQSQSAAPAAQAMIQPQPAAPAAQMTAPRQPAEPTVQALTQPQPAAPAPQVAPAPQPAAPAAQAMAAPQPAAPAAQAAPAPKPAAQPKPAPSTAVASVNARDSSRVKVSPAPRAQRERDDLERRVMMLQGATPETEQLVRESAKLDPSLPAPDMSALRSNTEVRAPYQSNPPTIGTTGQPVRDSAKADPALPPPDTTATRAAMSRAATTDQPVTSRHTNPVAAAMTDQLVKGSAMLDPSLPPPK
ncbi:hypothetical protein GCT13_39530 [Paraburkholderia sp. CNPSo 3157]|uniref:Extensin n=1 Tax=Paraburkholderia franconis TaxID=2654983 RepID=A0A7X1TKI1_9BURK|nr:hypothetical protein [Paraburkholderia franconis]MPW22737.1 hypothetical protein [Paraburkholderia franconis]